MFYLKMLSCCSLKIRENTFCETCTWGLHKNENRCSLWLVSTPIFPGLLRSEHWRSENWWSNTKRDPKEKCCIGILAAVFCSLFWYTYNEGIIGILFESSFGCIFAQTPLLWIWPFVPAPPPPHTHTHTQHPVADLGFLPPRPLSIDADYCWPPTTPGCSRAALTL